MLNFAIKYRPRTLEDIVGQDHLVGKEGIIRKFIKSGRVPHVFLQDRLGREKRHFPG